MKNQRIYAFDALRTAAILAVILTHIPLNWLPPVGRLGQALIYFLASSGKIGVSILFLLTGFLMARLHPRPGSAIEFYARRFARLLPLYIILVISLSIIRSNNLPALIQLGLVLGLAGIARGLSRFPVGRKFTFLWLGAMLTAAGAYVFWLNRVPPAVFYQLWPPLSRNVISALMNLFMALPFGQYVAQLDGVYWALILEVWFYLLYPVLIVPLWPKFKPYLVPAAMLFCFGLQLIAERVWGLKMLEPVLFIYFFAGIALAGFKKPPAVWLRPSIIVGLLLLASAGQFYLTDWLPDFYYSWMRLLLVLPLGFLVLIGANLPAGPSLLTRLSPYGYAAFLTHSLVIDWCFRLIKPESFFSGILLIMAVFAGSFALAKILYLWAEKPYFLTAPLAESRIKPGFTKPYLRLILALIILLDLAFRPPLAFFTVLTRHGRPAPDYILSQEPLRFNLTASADNLGMITSHLKAKIIDGVTDVSAKPAQLFIRLYEGRDRLLAETGYRAADIYEDRYHPFGFPVQAGSRGKNYILEYQLEQTDFSREVRLTAGEQNFVSVYFQPVKNFDWFINKLLAPFSSPLYWLSLVCLLPLLGWLAVSGRWRRG